MPADDQGGARPAPVVLRIKLRYDDVETMVQRFAPNVGKSGLFLPTKSLQPVGTEIKFELRIANDTPVLVGLGRVKAVKAPDPANPRAAFGLAIELMRVTREGREVIIRMIERRRSIGLADVAIPMPEDVESAKRADVETQPRAEAAAVAMPPAAAPDSAPILSAPPPIATPLARSVTPPVKAAPIVTAPTPAEGAAVTSFTSARRSSGSIPAVRPDRPSAPALAPEPVRAKRRGLAEVLAQAERSGPMIAGPMMAGPMMAGPMMAGPMMAGPMMEGSMMAGPAVDPDLDLQIDLDHAMARARTLAAEGAAGDLDAELAELRENAAAPLAEISIEAASAELARQLGGVSVSKRMRGVALGTAEAPMVTLPLATASAQMPVVEPVVATLPAVEPVVATLPAVKPVVAPLPAVEPVVATLPAVEPVVATLPAVDLVVATLPAVELVVATLPAVEPVVATLPAVDPVVATLPAVDPLRETLLDRPIEDAAPPAYERPVTSSSEMDQLAAEAAVGIVVAAHGSSGVVAIEQAREPEPALRPRTGTAPPALIVEDDAELSSFARALDDARIHTGVETPVAPQRLDDDVAEIDPDEIEELDNTHVGQNPELLAAPAVPLADSLDRHLDQAEAENEELQRAIQTAASEFEAELAQLPEHEAEEPEPEDEEEISDLDVLAEADAEDADLMTAHGERESQDGAPAYVTPADPYAHDHPAADPIDASAAYNEHDPDAFAAQDRAYEAAAYEPAQDPYESAYGEPAQDPIAYEAAAYPQQDPIAYEAAYAEPARDPIAYEAAYAEPAQDPIAYEAAYAEPAQDPIAYEHGYTGPQQYTPPRDPIAYEHGYTGPQQYTPPRQSDYAQDSETYAADPDAYAAYANERAASIAPTYIAPEALYTAQDKRGYDSRGRAGSYEDPQRAYDPAYAEEAAYADQVASEADPVTRRAGELPLPPALYDHRGVPRRAATPEDEDFDFAAQLDLDDESGTRPPAPYPGGYDIPSEYTLAEQLPTRAPSYAEQQFPETPGLDEALEFDEPHQFATNTPAPPMPRSPAGTRQRPPSHQRMASRGVSPRAESSPPYRQSEDSIDFDEPHGFVAGEDASRDSMDSLESALSTLDVDLDRLVPPQTHVRGRQPRAERASERGSRPLPGMPPERDPALEPPTVRPDERSRTTGRNVVAKPAVPKPGPVAKVPPRPVGKSAAPPIPKQPAPRALSEDDGVLIDFDDDD